MSTAVAKVLENGERQLTEGFTRFMLHYRFKAEFCNPASGNEKGHVENKVGYIRRNVLVPMPTITSFDEFNEMLWQWCEKDAKRVHYRKEAVVQELWEEESKELLYLPEVDYDVFRYESFRVSKTGFVSIDKNRYGLAPELHGQTVQAKIYYDRIEFFSDRVPVAKYRRSYGKNEELMDWTQYIRTLCRKPGAAENARFFSSMPQGWQKYISMTAGNERRNALQLLEDILRDGNACYCDDVLTLAYEIGRSDVDSVRQCYYSLLKEGRRPEPLKITAVVPVLNYTPDLTAYDRLTGGAGNGND